MEIGWGKSLCRKLRLKSSLGITTLLRLLNNIFKFSSVAKIVSNTRFFEHFKQLRLIQFHSLNFKLLAIVLFSKSKVCSQFTKLYANLKQISSIRIAPIFIPFAIYNVCCIKELIFKNSCKL